MHSHDEGPAPTAGHAEGSAPAKPGLAGLAEDLTEQTPAITERWHSELVTRLRLRPQKVFPGDELLDGMPAVVQWVAHTLRNGRELDRANEDSLHEVAEHWRDGGFSIEEALLHFRILGSLLHEHLQSAVAERGFGPSDAARASERLCHALNVASVVLVASYRDAEEERFTDFASTLAHEVRDHLGASLTAVQAVDVLRRQDDEGSRADQAELLARAESGLEKAQDLVASVRALSHMGGPPGERWEKVSLRDLVEDLQSELREAHAGDTRLEVADEFPDVRVPRDPVTIVLHNLVENALKYADPDKSERWVRLHCRREDDGHLVVQVGDNGLGIPETEQKRIFARFRRGSQARGDGFGLGLAIARQAGRQMGSRLMLESRVGEGSTFGFTIPEDVQE